MLWPDFRTQIHHDKVPLVGFLRQWGFFFFTEELGSLFLFYFFLTQTFCFAGFSSDLKSHTSLFFFLPFQDLPGTEEESQNLPLVASSNFELNKEWNSRKSANSKRRRQVVEPVWHSRRLQPQRPPAVAPPTKLTNQCVSLSASKLRASVPLRVLDLSSATSFLFISTPLLQPPTHTRALTPT